MKDRIVMTQGVNSINQDPKMAKCILEAVHKFLANDWGISQDKQMNDADPKDAMGVYVIPYQGETKIWIKSDNYNGHEGIDRLITILLPSEY